MNSYDKRLVERLRNWEKVYPEDEDKPEGNLYPEAAERIVDISISIMILILVWLLQYKVILESLFEDDLLYFIDNNIWTIIYILIFLFAVMVILVYKIEKIKTFFKGILEGFLSLTKLKKKLFPFILFSALIWTCYILAFFVIKFSVSELDIIDNSLIFPAFVVGVFSISFSNHGLGVYPLAISLFLLTFGINTEIGLTYGWLAWSCQAIITLIFGGLSFFVLPLLNAKHTFMVIRETHVLKLALLISYCFKLLNKLIKLS